MSPLTLVAADIAGKRVTEIVPGESATTEPVVLEMDGQSLGGHGQRRFSRPAVPAENMMQAFIWYQLVPAEQWTVVLSGKAGTKLPLGFPPVDRVKLKLGETTLLGARLTQETPAPGEIRVELSEPPAGITLRAFDPATDESAAYRLIDDAFNALAIEILQIWLLPADGGPAAAAAA